jgi:outer membrane protein OmpA-like peptidoglycan-associated protein
MLKFFIKMCAVIFIGLTLIGCVSTNLSKKQQNLLKQEGFNLTDDGWSLGLPDDLLFEFNHYDIADNTKIKISHLSAQLLKFNLQKLKIIGHTDNVGSPEYNLKLSQKRAETIKDLFVAQGYKPENILVIGRGATQPLSNNSTKEHRSMNRRVNIIIIP